MPTARSGIVIRGVCSSSTNPLSITASGNNAMTAGVASTLSVPVFILCHPVLERLQALGPADDEHLAAAPDDRPHRQLLQRRQVFVRPLGLDRYEATGVADRIVQRVALAVAGRHEHREV